LKPLPRPKSLVVCGSTIAEDPYEYVGPAGTTRLKHCRCSFMHLHIFRQVILDVLGGGSETQRWEGLSRHLSLQGITWHGQLAYRDALERMGQADLFVHTSTREATSTVVLEALSLGLPVMCHDACGMALAIDDTCGIKVPFVCPEQSILGFRNALNQILQEPGLIQKLSEGALRRASALSWDSKVKQLAESYIHCTQS